MGKDDKAVVDSEPQVRGLEGLRVAAEVPVASLNINLTARFESHLGGELFLHARAVRLSKLGVALLPIFVRIGELAANAQKTATPRLLVVGGVRS